jgi:hypothetical protein
VTAGEPLTNLRLQERVLQQIVQEVEGHLALTDSSRLHYSSPPEKAAWEWLFEKALYDILGTGHDLRLRRVEPTALEMPVLFYAPLELTIRYESAADGRTIRHASGRLFVKYHNTRGDLLFAREMTGSSVDTVARNKLAALEDPGYPFTVGRTNPRGGVKRFLEPVVLTLITGGIIYLFYSFRSN